LKLQVGLLAGRSFGATSLPGYQAINRGSADSRGFLHWVLDKGSPAAEIPWEAELQLPSHSAIRFHVLASNIVEQHALFARLIGTSDAERASLPGRREFLWSEFSLLNERSFF